MIKINKKLITPVLLLAITIKLHASEVTLEISGEGEVSTSTQTCTTGCTLDTSIERKTLVAKAKDGWSFTGWQGQKCDMGNQVIIAAEKNNIKTISEVEGGAKTLETIDFNNDGLDDLIAISLFDGQLLRFENLGDGTFTSKLITSDFSYPTALDSYDWNGDGFMDIFVADYGRGDIRLLLNDGHGDFSFSQSFTFNNAKPYAFSVIDYDFDGKADFVLSSFEAQTYGDLFVLVDSIENEEVKWYKTTDTGLIEQVVIASVAAMTLDTNQSSFGVSPDIVTAEIITGEVAVYSGDNGVNRNVVATGGAPYGVSFGDVDGNDNIDILVANYRPSMLNLIYGNDNGSFSTAQIIASREEGLTATAFGDFNNDSFVDVATGEFNINKFFYYPTVGFNQCVVSKSSSLNVVAVFKEDEQSPSTPVPSTEVSESNGESGGSVQWLSLFLLVMLGKPGLSKRTNNR